MYSVVDEILTLFMGFKSRGRQTFLEMSPNALDSMEVVKITFIWRVVMYFGIRNILYLHIFWFINKVQLQTVLTTGSFPLSRH